MSVASILAWTTLVGGGLVLILALIDIVLGWRPQKNAKAAIGRAAAAANQNTAPNGGLNPQAGVNFKDSWEALAKLATALKELDRSSRLFVISLGLFAIAGATIGVETIAQAIGSVPPR